MSAGPGQPLSFWLPCLPGILLARLLGLGPVGIGLAWRVQAGVMVPLGWYVLLRRYVGPAPLTAALVILLTADVGAMSGRKQVFGAVDWGEFDYSALPAGRARG